MNLLDLAISIQEKALASGGHDNSPGNDGKPDAVSYLREIRDTIEKAGAAAKGKLPKSARLAAPFPLCRASGM